MSKFKPGDRIRAIKDHKVVGTVTHVSDGMPFVVLDNFFVSDDHKTKVKEGYLTKAVEDIFELTEKSDWASIWDDAAE